MITPENRKILEALDKTQYGAVLKEYLNGKLEEIRDLQTITSFDDALGRKRAEKIINEIFSFMSGKPVAPKKEHPYT